MGPRSPKTVPGWMVGQPRQPVYTHELRMPTLNSGPAGTDRLLGSLLGLGVGAILGCVSAATAVHADFPTYVALSLANGLMVAIAGAIAGRRMKLYACAGVGILIGVVLVSRLGTFPKEQFSGAVGLGSGPGALAGSMIGLIVGRIFGWFR